MIENVTSRSLEVKPTLLKVRRLGKVYYPGGRELAVLRETSFDLSPGETCAIVGPSGSGKTTLLGLCAGLDDPSSGTVELDGVDLASLDQDRRAALRNEKIGFVFQSFQLIPTITALENIMIPLELRKAPNAEALARELVAKVGLADRMHHYPLQLSGGEQQRVALARAFIHRPKILFADEPTGNLDAETSGPITDMLFQLNKENGTALVLVTHDMDLAQRADRVIHMRAGTLVDA